MNRQEMQAFIQGELRATLKPFENRLITSARKKEIQAAVTARLEDFKRKGVLSPTEVLPRLICLQHKEDRSKLLLVDEYKLYDMAMTEQIKEWDL